jgi:DNA repair protein RadC
MPTTTKTQTPTSPVKGHPMTTATLPSVIYLTASSDTLVTQAPKVELLPLVRVQVVRDRTVSYPMNAEIADADELARIARSITQDMDREALVVMYLSNAGRVNAVEIVSIGSLDGAIAHPREVFKGALMSNAAAIAIAHNHPSGDSRPSEADLGITARLLEAGAILDIPVVDHVIIGEDDYTSLRNTTRLWRQYGNG